MRPSTLETLVLARSRCHLVIVKVVASGANVAPRPRLHGRTIIFPHDVSDVKKDTGVPVTMDEMLCGAMQYARVVFVAPNGRSSTLENSALLVNDLRLRADVLFSHLTLAYQLRCGDMPPELEAIRASIETHSVQRHLVDTATIVADDAVERASVPSDVANVRAAAQSGAHKLAK